MSRVIPTLLSTTPDTVNTSAPAANDSTKPKTFNNNVLDPQLTKNRKPIKQERKHDVALKMVYKLEKMNYGDTDFLNNSTKEERHNIIALAKYYALERFDPSNKYVKNFGNQEILQL